MKYQGIFVSGKNKQNILNISRRHFELFFFFVIFPRKQVLTFHAYCLLRGKFA